MKSLPYLCSIKIKKAMTTKEKNVSKLRTSDCYITKGRTRHYLNLDGFKYLLDENWVFTLQMNVDNEHFVPEWLLTTKQQASHSIKLLQKYFTNKPTID